MRFLLLDRLEIVEPGRRALAKKTFSPDDDYLADHFPGIPVVPGTLLTEAMGQAGGWLLAETFAYARWPLLTMVDKAKFRRLVRPGEGLTIEATVLSMHESDFSVKGEATAGGERVADARFLFHAFDFTLTEEERARFDAWRRSALAELAGPRA